VRFVGVGPYSLDLEVVAYVTTADCDEFLKLQQEPLLKCYWPWNMLERNSRCPRRKGLTRNVLGRFLTANTALIATWITLRHPGSCREFRRTVWGFRAVLLASCEVTVLRSG
jgi:hypothetical protein